MGLFSFRINLYRDEMPSDFFLKHLHKDSYVIQVQIFWMTRYKQLDKYKFLCKWKFKRRHDIYKKSLSDTA